MHRHNAKRNRRLISIHCPKAFIIVRLISYVSIHPSKGYTPPKLSFFRTNANTLSFTAHSSTDTGCLSILNRIERNKRKIEGINLFILIVCGEL